MTSKTDQFIDIAKPDKNGFSDNIKISDLPQNLRDNNGKAWSRESALGKDFYMEKTYEKGKINTRIEKQKSNGSMGALISIRLDGYKNE